tara:strand:- start:341 stop:589 length:249 start_codon:yes stop_codon:yes gene_type:complete
VIVLLQQNFKYKGYFVKLKVGNRNYYDDKITMKTSIRGDYYSIRFHKFGGNNEYSPEFWGHLNETQAKRMINDLKHYIKLQT